MAVHNVSLMDSGHLPQFRRINSRALNLLCFWYSFQHAYSIYRRPVVICPDMGDVVSSRCIRLLTCTCLVRGHAYYAYLKGNISLH